MAIDSIPRRLLEQAKARPNHPAYHVRGPSGQWVATDYATFARQVRQAARAMIGLGLPARGTVSILGFNRPEWVIFDLACMMAGGAPAGIYTTCSPAEVRYIVDHAESPIVLVENENQYKKVQSERDKGGLPKLRWIVLMAGAQKPAGDAGTLTWDEFMAKGAPGFDAELDARLDALGELDNATFIYTSGTTGPPKAVMLSTRNLTWTADCARMLVDVQPADSSLSYLPLSHIAEQMFTLHIPITVGSQVFFATSIDKVADNLKEVRPTVVFGVPRIWEKMHAGVSQKLQGATGLKKKLLEFAQKTSRDVHAITNTGGTVGGLLGFKYKLANKLIYSKVKAAIGLDRARVCVSGAAPIGKDVLDFFQTLDLTILEVYGQSEGSGPTSINIPGRTRIGSVGPALPGVEVKIADDGEILVKGPNVFLGYYKDDAATSETLINGYLQSGDLGKFDEQGYLWITGRKKEIIITAGGKNIAPKNIEEAIRHSPLVAQAVVIGDRRKFLSALVTLNPEGAGAWAKANGVPEAGMHEDAKLIAELKKYIDHDVNSQFAQVEHIRKFTVLPADFSIDGGELTGTLKIKRKVVAQKYEAQIEAMYAGDKD